MESWKLLYGISLEEIPEEACAEEEEKSEFLYTEWIGNFNKKSITLCF